MLESSNNPFGTVVRAYLKARETTKDPSERLTWKWRLTRELYLRGLDRATVLNLFRFIDWILQLPAELELWSDAALDAASLEEVFHPGSH
jgi:hypothetical protein